MDSRKLRKSSRQELLEMLLLCEQSGSLAEAALKLSGIFEAADEAVRIYQASLKPEQDPEPVNTGEQDGPSQQS